MTWPSRLSVNQIMAIPRPLNELLDEAGRAGVAGIGLNCEHVAAFGFDRALQLVRDAGIPISLYAAAGYWASGADPDGKPQALEDNIRKLDEAVAMGVDTVGITSGGLVPGDKDLRSARARVADGVAQLIPLAAERNLKLALEPLHPVFGPTRAVYHTLGQALDLIESLDAENLGVFVDTYHSWWDPTLQAQLRRAGERIFVVQVCDWSPEMVTKNYRDRAMVGEGCIDFSTFTDCLGDYTGWIDVEAPNANLHNVPLMEIFERVLRSYSEVLAERIPAS